MFGPKKDKNDKKDKKDDIRKSKEYVASKITHSSIPVALTQDTTYLRSFRKGYVERRFNNTWKYIYVILIGGSLNMYHNSTDSEPFNTIILSKSMYTQGTGITVSTEPIKEVDRAYFFALRETTTDTKEKEKILAEKKAQLQNLVDTKMISEEVFNKKLADITSQNQEKDTQRDIRFIGSVPSSIELRLWRDDLMKAIAHENIGQVPRPFSVNSDKATKKIHGPKSKTKSQKYSADIDTLQILESLKYLVNLDKGQKRGEVLEKNIISLIGKSIGFISTRQIKSEDLLPTEKLMKNIFEYLVKIYNAKKLIQKNAIMEKALEKVENLLKDIEKNLLKIFESIPNVKNLIQPIFAEFTIDFFKTILDSHNSEVQKHLEKMVDAMGKYTQFQYNS